MTAYSYTTLFRGTGGGGRNGEQAKFGSFKIDKQSSTPYSDATKVRLIIINC
jgi:hypothetical protein